MNRAFSSMERNSIVVCCALSLLLFFFPLLTIHVPIAGQQEVSGYNLFSKLNQLRENVKSSDLPSADKRSRSARVPSAPDLPLSVQVSWLIPVAIAVAFLSAAVALLGAFLSARFARVACALGACASAMAILHTMVMNSDIHSSFAGSMRGRKGAPFGGFGEGLGSVVASAFQLKPGWGLYSLLVLLGVAAALGFSRILSRLEIAPVRRSPQ